MRNDGTTELAAAAGTTAETRATFAAETWDPADRSVDVVLYTGAAVDRASFFSGRYQLQLSMEPGAADLSRLNAGGPLLDSHNSERLADQIGAFVPGSVRLEGGAYRGRVRFSSRDDVKWIAQDVADGIIRGFSVGVSLDQVTKTERDNDVPLHIATRWSVMEGSLVSVPADPGAQTLGAQRHDTDPAGVTLQEQAMPEINDTQTVVDLDAVRKAAKAEGQAAGMRLAAERTEAILSAAKRLKLGADHETVVAALKDASTDIATLREQLFDAAASADDAHGVSGVHTAELVADDLDKRFGAMESAMLYRSRPDSFAAPDPAGAQHYVEMSMLDLCCELLEAKGVRNPRKLGKQGIWQRAIAPSGQFAGIMTTGDFPLALANTGRKVLMRGYETEARTFLPISSRRISPDFKTMSEVRMGDAPSLLRVLEGAEYKHGAVSEEREQWTILKYGRKLGLTYEAFVNDDLNAFGAQAFMFGGSVARLEGDVWWAVVTDNANMNDGNALFSAAHRNLIGAAPWAALTAAHASNPAAIGAVRNVLGDQRGLDAARINLGLAAIAIPKGQEHATVQAMSGQWMPTTSATAMPAEYRGVTVIAEPRLDDVSADVWYGFASPAASTNMVHAYLAGAESPQMFREEAFNTDQVEFKIRHHFAAKALDWVGIVNNPGA